MAESRMRKYLRVLPALIVIAAAACDNVDWGGVDFAIVPPPAKGEPAPIATDSTGAPAMPTLPGGPVLYYVRRGGGQPVMVPVGEVSGDTLRTIRPGPDPKGYDDLFISQFLRESSEFTLYHAGMRVGTFVVESATPAADGVCPALPVAHGSLELSSRADSVNEFLAMSKRQAVEPWRMPTDVNPTSRMKVLGPILAERLLRARGSQLPNNWAAAMKQIHPFPVEGMPTPAFTGSLLVGDQLQVGGNGTGFSLYFVAMPNSQAGYDTAFARYVNYPQQGKLATRTIDFLDWDRDGAVELLTDNYGAQGEWIGAVGQADGEWRQIFDARCRSGGVAAAGATAPADTVGGSAPPGGDKGPTGRKP